jgi:hypothetical protein
MCKLIANETERAVLMIDELASQFYARLLRADGSIFPA